MDRYWSRNVSVGQGRNDRITLYAIECRDKTEIKHSSEETVIDYSQVRVHGVSACGYGLNYSFALDTAARTDISRLRRSQRD